MPKGNPRPKLENLTAAGKGRERLNNLAVAIKMSRITREMLECIALQYGCLRGGKPYIGGLLAKIGSGELIVVPAPPKLSPE